MSRSAVVAAKHKTEGNDMSNSIRIRASINDGVAEIKAIIVHPMETGQRKDKQSGKIVPAHFIKEIEASVQGRQVLRALWGGGISKNPYLFIKVDNAKPGDKITMSWLDNRGQTGSGEAVLK
jgi:sulfur-oxidizing protein SoxZ